MGSGPDRGQHRFSTARSLDSLEMSTKLMYRSVRGGWWYGPDEDVAGPGAADGVLAVGGISEVCDRPQVAHWRAERQTRGRIPESRCRVAAAGEQDHPVRTDHDRQYRLAVRQRPGHERAGVGTPQFGHVIASSDQYLRAVRRGLCVENLIAGGPGRPRGLERGRVEEGDAIGEGDQYLAAV